MIISLHFVQVFPHNHRVPSDDNRAQFSFFGLSPILSLLDLDCVVQHDVEELVVALEHAGHVSIRVESQVDA